MFGAASELALKLEPASTYRLGLPGFFPWENRPAQSGWLQLQTRPARQGPEALQTRGEDMHYQPSPLRPAQSPLWFLGQQPMSLFCCLSR